MDMTEYAHRIEQLKTKLYRTAISMSAMRQPL